jgi:hypothetical protein
MSEPSALLKQRIEGLRGRALIVGAAGMLVTLAGWLIDPTQFYRSYLFAYLFWIGVSIGCLSILMIHHLSGGAWGLGIRRMLEAGSRLLFRAWILFLPVLIGVRSIYAWADPGKVAGDEMLRHKSVYLNVPFFAGRAVFYFACWAALAYFLNKWSLQRDQRGSEARLSERLQGLAGGGLVLMGLTITFASVDWAMSLNPHWFSTIYGVLFMVGQVLSALALMIVMVASIGNEKPLVDVISRESVHDLGKLLFAFVMVWAYISISQFLIIWSGNLPEEIPWYIQRLHGGWQWVALALVLFHFALPFLLLLSRDMKRNPRVLASIAASLFGLRLLDLFWLVAPDMQGHGHAAGFAMHWLDVAAPVGLGGLWLAGFGRELLDRPLLTAGDPELQELMSEAHA